MSAEAWRRAGSNGRREAAAFFRGRRGTFSCSGWICVARLAFSALQPRFAWQARRLSVPAYMSGQMDAVTPLHFFMAGLPLSAPQARFAWQARHFQYLHRCPRELGAVTPLHFFVAGVALSAARAGFVWQV